MRKLRRSAQLTFEDVPRWGGRRPNSGPKPGRRPKVRHRARGMHRHWRPVHVTMRAKEGLPSLREQVLFAAVTSAIRATKREDFRIVEFSVQRDHVHAIIEAADGAALTRGMRSLSVRVARRVNRALRRRSGRVWGDRYHRQDLGTPKQVRNALVYVLANFRKHLGITHGRPALDRCSSAPWFEGWLHVLEPPPTEGRPTEPAQTRLLTSLWQRHGLIHPGESPRVRR